MISILTGSNSFLRAKRLRELKDDFSRKYGKEHIENVAGEELTADQLPSLLQGASLFSSNRMIIIRDLSANKEVAEKLLDLLEKIPDETDLVIIESQLDKRSGYYKNLKKQKGFEEFNEPDDMNLSKWIIEYSKEQGGEIGGSEARLLLDYVGADQQRLANEIEKLVSYNPKISSNSIKELVEPRPQSTVFQMLDFALSGQVKKAIDVLENLERAYEDPSQLTNLLIWQVNTLAIVKSAGSRTDSEIAKDMKINLFVVSKTKKLARGIDQKKLNNIINQCVDLDLRLKTTSANPWRLIETTILSF